MSRRPMRVLQVVGAMNRGGVETWLMHILRHRDPQLLQMDFLVHTQARGAYDAEIGARASRVIRCDVSWRSMAYGRAVGSILQNFGPYDAVHSHVHHFSGFVLALARRAGVAARIAHSHSDTAIQDSQSSWLRRRYLDFARALIGRCANHLLAVSRSAGNALFGSEWELDPRSRVLHCGIDLAPYRRLPSRAAIRRRLGWEADDFVIGHVGRLDTPKNHGFLVEVAAAAARRNPKVRLALVGDGPVREAIVRKVEELGMSAKTRFLGSRADVPDLLASIDTFVFPSMWEGLPLTVIEAQAAGVPCLISDCITPEAIAVPELVRSLPLPAGPEAWADALSPACDRDVSRSAALASLEATDFNIEKSLEALYALYGA